MSLRRRSDMNLRLLVTLCIMLIVLPVARAAEENAVALRIRFGLKDKEPTARAGPGTSSAGKVGSSRGWRWMPGDHAEGNSFTVSTRRAVAQGAAERARVEAGGR